MFYARQTYPGFDGYAVYLCVTESGFGTTILPGERLELSRSEDMKRLLRSVVEPLLAETESDGLGWTVHPTE